MKRKALLIASLLNALPLLAQAPPLSAPSATYVKLPKAPAEMTQNVPNQVTPPHMGGEGMAAAIQSRPGQSEVMIIHPEMRGKDLLEAFEYLQKTSPSSKLGIELINGSFISGILDMTLMTGGTLIVFRISSTQGQKYQVVKIEDISAISTQ